VDGLPRSLTTFLDAGWIDVPDLTPDLLRMASLLGVETARASRRVPGADLAALFDLVRAGEGLAVLPERLLGSVDGVDACRIVAPQLEHRVEVLVRRSGPLRADELAGRFDDHGDTQGG
jgi:DNA-binding transcriptional LysR family regulator